MAAQSQNMNITLDCQDPEVLPTLISLQKQQLQYSLSQQCSRSISEDSEEHFCENEVNREKVRVASAQKYTFFI